LAQYTTDSGHGLLPVLLGNEQLIGSVAHVNSSCLGK
jgi:hypothetical protein